MFTIAVGSDNLITRTSDINAQTGATITNATVTFTLYQIDGATVLSGPTSMTWSNTNQRYEGILPASVTSGLTSGRTYMLGVLAVSGGGTNLIREPAYAQYES